MKQTLLIPREIAEWVEYCKSCSITLYGALDPVDKFGMSIAETFNGDALKCAKWARTNSNEFAYAWVNGYEVDEKHYYVAIPVEGGRYRRLLAYNNATLALDDHNYYSIDKLIEHTKNSTRQITEKMIKDSPLSWAWQFAKELEL